MSEHLNYQAHVAIKLNGATKADVKRALDAACKQLCDGTPHGNGELPGKTAQYYFSTTLHNVAEPPRPVPNPPTQS